MSKAKNPLYTVWASMKQRCGNPNSSGWARYGGRGITVCERWFSFENFIADMKERPQGYSLDRIDNEKGYSPDNCRWASHAVQQLNKSSRLYVTIRGQEYRVCELSKKTGLKGDTIVARAKKGMSYEECTAKTRYPFTGGVRRAVEVRIANQLNASHCKKGHPWSTENTLIHRQGRLCRECYKIRKGIKRHRT